MRKLFTIEKELWNGGRKIGEPVEGCLCVNIVIKVGGKYIKTTLFSIDTPKREGYDTYSCHVDGTDYEFETLEECLVWGFYVDGRCLKKIYLDI